MAKRASDAEEQAVIDDDLIAAALAEEQTSAASKHVGQVALADMVAEAHVLRLSFKNIKRIDNLHGFQALTKLCLDNNVIREISDLDHLVNLEWLDLSFNNIAKIEGLEKLTKLTDLSLFNNLIQDVDGLDTCANLQCLSIGTNNIAALDSIVKLRRFKSLRLLNMEGNPVSKESEYRMYVLAYLNNLTYLDYAMVMKSEIVAAREQYQDELLDVEEKEALEEEKATREAAAARQTAKLQAANLAVVETIFDDMFKEDTEMAKLKYLAGINDIVANFQSEVESSSDQFLTVGLEKDKSKGRETSRFSVALKELRQQYAGDSVKMIEEFNRQKKRVFRQLQIQNRDHVEHGDLEELRAEVAKLGNALMDLEMRQVEQFEDIMNEFENKYREINAACLEAQQSYFRAVEECENSYLRDLMTLVNELLEKAAKEELPEDLPEEASNLLIDRDTCLTAITGSHDIHVGKLYKREEETKFNEITHCTETVRNYRDEEHTRNRNRIIEIQEFLESNRKQLNDLVTREVIDEYDDVPAEIE
jgi:hypothetical protein